MRAIHLLAALPLTGLFAQVALAQGAPCTKQLQLKNEVQMTSTAGGPSTIPVKLNGTDQKLILSTAGTTTQITADAAKSLKLEPKKGDMMLPDFLTGGMRKVDEVTIADFSLGTLHGTNVTWPVSGFGGGRGGGGGGGDDAAPARPAGQFSLNYMRLYDIDVDFGSDKLRFFSQDHCPAGVLYWKAPGEVGVVPLTIDNGRVLVPVTVNGKAVNAVIDTASPNSKVYAAVAQKVLGVELGGAKAPAGRSGFGGQTYNWSIDSLGIGPKLKLENIAVTVQPDINAGAGDHGDGAAGMRARSSALQYELDHPEITLGMDALRKMHLYFAFGENRLYATGTTDTLSTAAAPKTP